MNLLEFIDRAPSPYHAIAAAEAILRDAGFAPVAEGDRWRLDPGATYFAARGGKTLLAWRVGAKPPAEVGFRIVAAHSDSPVLKLRPNPGRRARDAALLNTEIYGSPLLHTWLDRDLKLAGRVFFRGPDDTVAHRLLELPELPLRVNSLAPHLKRERKISGVDVDLQKGLALTFSQDDDDIVEQLNAVVSDRFGVTPDLGYDLSLADIQPSALAGRNGEFISAPRLDNLFSSFCALTALIDAGPSDRSQIAVLYDAEEIGSQTWTGARGDALGAVLQRLNAAAGGDAEDLLRANAKSVLISADMAHAEHPSHTSATDPDHVPEINGGLAVKSSSQANYAIGHPAAAWFEMVAGDAGLNLQKFMYRCDHGGGSSVGPMVTTNNGICGIDVGAPMLAMHSIREMAGANDVDHTTRAFTAFYDTDAPFAA